MNLQQRLVRHNKLTSQQLRNLRKDKEKAREVLLDINGSVPKKFVDVDIIVLLSKNIYID